MYIPSNLGDLDFLSESWALVEERRLGPSINRLPLQYIDLYSHIALVALENNDPSTVSEHWYLGGWANVVLPYNITPGSYFQGRTQIMSVALPLGNFQLIAVPQTLPVPFTLRIHLVKYLRDVHLEVWRYVGTMPDP